MEDCLLVTGGAGFIGSNFVAECVNRRNTPVINLDKLTYAGNLRNLDNIDGKGAHTFVRGDINDRGLVHELLRRYQPRAIVHFAAESHVDRSILGPEQFVETNIVGTFHLLLEALTYWQTLPCRDKADFRFLHVSTDEVYGSLAADDPAFTEMTPYSPNSPYSASKASADHFALAYHHTYGLPVIVTNCSNNYGPFQFPEKFIPLMIDRAIHGKPIPVYGDGRNVRDWLYVTDHCDALLAVLERGRVGERYNIGGQSERSNLQVVHVVCSVLDALSPNSPVKPHESLISFVPDRPGHDHRYAMDTTKIERELGWGPVESFDTGISKTVAWYLEHQDWVEHVTSGAYQRWLDTNYANRMSA